MKTSPSVGGFRRALGLVALAAGCATPAAAEPPRVYALTNGTVVTAPGETIESATVVVRDGLIEAVGEVAPPADAWEIDCSGLRIYPGLIDVHSQLGLRPERVGGAGAPAGGEPAGSARSEAQPLGAAHPISRIRPETRSRDRLVPFSGDRRREARRYRELGFTVVVAVPERGILRGSSAAILLADDAPVPDLILKEPVAQHVGFERGGAAGIYPSSLMGAVAALRQTLLDTRRHREWSERYAADPRGMRRPERVAAYDALGPVLTREQPLFFALEQPADLLLADALAREFDLRAVMSASGHEWEIAGQVAAAGRALVLPLTRPDKPQIDEDDEALDVSLREMRRYLEAPRGPRVLDQAGVEFAFTTHGLKNLGDFKRNMQRVLEAGLSQERALAAWTTVPARLIGLDAVIGTITPGKIANLVVADGPLFGKDTSIKQVFVDGEEYRTKQKRVPKGDPDAVVDPRGEWSVVFEFAGQAAERIWNISGERGSYRGTAETRAGTVTFERVELTGNMLTVVFPPRGNFPAFELTVVIEGDAFEGVAEMGSRSIPVKATRTRGPEKGTR